MCAKEPAVGRYVLLLEGEEVHQRMLAGRSADLPDAGLADPGVILT